MKETWQHRFIETNGIRMHYVEQSEGFPVLLLHGFPELWYSWRFQIPALANAGFHVIAPDLRGFGETDKPTEPEAYDIHHIIGDITGLLDALNFEKAVIIGHDWGGRIGWYIPLMVPERVERIVSLNTHFRPREPVPPTQHMRNNLEKMRQTGELEKKRAQVNPMRKFKYSPNGSFEYQLQFQEPGRVEAEVMPDPGAWLETVDRQR